MGFVASRTLEAATIYVGIVSLMSIVTLRRAGAGAGALVVGQGLAAQYQWTFFFAQSFIPAINGVLLGSLFISRASCLDGFRCWDSSERRCSSRRGSPSCRSHARGRSRRGAAAVPIAVWEFSLGVYLTFWGFKDSPIIAGL